MDMLRECLPPVLYRADYLQDYLQKLESQFAEMKEMFSSQIAVKDRQIEKLMDLLGKLDGVIEEAKIVPLFGAKNENQALA